MLLKRTLWLRKLSTRKRHQGRVPSTISTKKRRKFHKRRGANFCQRTTLSCFHAHRISPWHTTLTNTTRNLISSIREPASDWWLSSSRCFSSLSRKFGLSRKRSRQWSTYFSLFRANTLSNCCKIFQTSKNSSACLWLLSTLTDITKRTPSWPRHP